MNYLELSTTKPDFEEIAELLSDSEKKDGGFVAAFLNSEKLKTPLTIVPLRTFQALAYSIRSLTGEHGSNALEDDLERYMIEVGASTSLDPELKKEREQSSIPVSELTLALNRFRRKVANPELMKAVKAIDMTSVQNRLSKLSIEEKRKQTPWNILKYISGLDEDSRLSSSRLHFFLNNDDLLAALFPDPEMKIAVKTQIVMNCFPPNQFGVGVCHALEDHGLKRQAELYETYLRETWWYRTDPHEMLRTRRDFQEYNEIVWRLLRYFEWAYSVMHRPFSKFVSYRIATKDFFVEAPEKAFTDVAI